MLESRVGAACLGTCERLLAANIKARTLQWYSGMNEKVVQWHGSTLTCEIHSFRGDATNSSRHDKLFNSDLLSVFSFGETAEACVTYPTLLKVPDNCKTAEQVALWESALQSTGMRTWNDSRAKTNHLRFFLGCSDQGGDEAAASRVLQDKVRQLPDCVFIWNFCFLHQIHLCVVKQLKRIPLFSPLAKIANSWRSPYSASRVYKIWEKEYGSESAASYLKRLIPRPLRGRWGSLYDTESYLLHCTRGRLEKVFRAAMAWRVALWRKELAQRQRGGGREHSGVLCSRTGVCMRDPECDRECKRQYKIVCYKMR